MAILNNQMVIDLVHCENTPGSPEICMETSQVAMFDQIQSPFNRVFLRFFVWGLSGSPKINWSAIWECEATGVRYHQITWAKLRYKWLNYGLWYPLAI